MGKIVVNRVAGLLQGFLDLIGKVFTRLDRAEVYVRGQEAPAMILNLDLKKSLRRQKVKRRRRRKNKRA